MTPLQYRQHPAMNWSRLKWLARSPLYFQHRSRNPLPPSSAMVIGSAADCMTLTPESYDDGFAVYAGKRDLRVKKYQEFCAENPGKIILSEKEAEQARGCSKAVLAKMAWFRSDEFLVYANLHSLNDDQIDECREFALDFGNSARQTPVFWTDEKTGIECKGLADCVGSNLTDLKTTHAAALDPVAFGRHALRMQYHGQLAWYRRGLRATGHTVRRAYLIVVEQTPPHDVMVQEVPEHDLELGESLCDDLLERYQECERLKLWHGSAPSISQLQMPEWAYHQDELELDWEAA